ncbi:helix-turn-helix transcriptional regulator [Methylobacterium sp. WL30]|uniref:helix-turn-helix domain-containing protein n=1 Tax=unclassified Methylobacterium TaxID=2615210 RepID=UPI0011CCAE2C|nr:MULTISPECIES: helix-turn-helix transcriptional regulator [unclassified Methylobacterium]TXN38959.1 helix-turn-helix transcriptional regulator [Methylobacterium sp. WL93]TXN52246.1 helix-turn-helix transcriptional regulator [Methylobacterium sp. WL119]TXN70671.1 helix-turn-helix transcriptional regulator [Methylobacterium sp. WL30]
MAGLPATDADRRIGERIQYARQAAQLTQREVATAAGVSAAQLQKYENGKNRVSASTLQVIADTVGRPVATFFDCPAPCLPSVEGCRTYPPGLAIVEAA